MAEYRNLPDCLPERLTSVNRKIRTQADLPERFHPIKIGKEREFGRIENQGHDAGIGLHASDFGKAILVEGQYYHQSKPHFPSWQNGLGLGSPEVLIPFPPTFHPTDSSPVRQDDFFQNETWR